MRVLQLRDGGSEPLRLDLHRQLSVVRGLRPEQRARIAAALQDLPRGRHAGVDGELEVHGIRLGLDEAGLALLGLAEDLDVVIGPEDLPGHDRIVLDATARREEAEEERRQAKRNLGRARAALAGLLQEQQRAHEALDQLRSDGDEAERARGELTQRVEQARDELKQRQEHLDAVTAELEQATAAHQQAVDARAATVGAVEEARETGRRAVERRAGVLANLEQGRAGVDPEADELLERARARLAELESVVLPEAEAADPAEAAAAAELEQRRARHREIQRLLLALPSTDATRVAEAVTALEAHQRLDPVEVPEAVALADRWRAFVEQVDVDEAPSQERIDEARARLESAKTELAAREGGAAARHEASDVKALEAAHAEVLEAQGRSEGRFGGRRADRRLAAARDAERAALERLGYSTYADFMMSSPTAPLTGDGDPDLEAARTAVGAARVELRALLEQTGDPAADARRAERSALEVATRELLSDDDADATDADATDAGRAEARLRALRRAPDAAPVVAELRTALAGAGVAVSESDDLDPATLVVLGEAWVREQQVADARRRDLQAELDALGEVGDADEPSTAGDPGTDVAEAMEARRRQAELDEAQGAVAALASRAEAHHQALAHLADLETTLEAAEADERTAAEALADREGEIEGHDQAVDDAAKVVERTEEVRLQALAQVDQASAAVAALDEETSRGPADEVAQRITARNQELDQVATRISAAETEVRLLEVRFSGTEERLTEAQDAERTANDSRPQSEAELDAMVDEIEWFLLTRLASQRAVGVVGSVPLVLDEPFGELGADATRRLVEHLTRLAPSVQVILMTDDGELAAWAESAGEDRAALVHAMPGPG